MARVGKLNINLKQLTVESRRRHALSKGNPDPLQAQGKRQCVNNRTKKDSVQYEINIGIQIIQQTNRSMAAGIPLIIPLQVEPCTVRAFSLTKDKFVVHFI